MITLVSGVPGSGKTYRAVYRINQISDKSLIMHNIDGLKVGTDLSSYCHDRDILPLDLFRRTFHDKRSDFHGWLFVIDEAQILFPKNFRDDDVLNFFQLHRHYDIEIWLLTQDFGLISPSISSLAEVCLRAVSDTANPLPGSFLYRKMAGPRGEAIGKEFIPKKKKVFRLYKSAHYNPSGRKKRRPMLFLLLAVFFVLISGVFLGRRWVSSLRSNSPPSSVSRSPASGPSSSLPSSRSSSSSSRSSFLDSSYSGVSNYDYPKSVVSLLSGIPYDLDYAIDSRGVYFIFLGRIWRKDELPFKVIRSSTGYIVLLPLDVYQYQSYLDSIDYDYTLADNSLPSSFDAPSPSPDRSDREARAGEGE